MKPVSLSKVETSEGESMKKWGGSFFLQNPETKSHSAIFQVKYAMPSGFKNDFVHKWGLNYKLLSTRNPCNIAVLHCESVWYQCQGANGKEKCQGYG